MAPDPLRATCLRMYFQPTAMKLPRKYHTSVTTASCFPGWEDVRFLHRVIPNRGSVDGKRKGLCGANDYAMADPATRTPVVLAPAPRRHRLLPRPRRLWSADQGGLDALLRRGRHRPRLGLPADAVDRDHGPRSGTDDGGGTVAHRAAAPDRLGPVDSGTAPTRRR